MMAMTRASSGVQVRARLSDDDRGALSLLFGGLESQLFLHSNFGAQLEQLAQLPKKERKRLCAPRLEGPPQIQFMDVKTTHVVRISENPWPLEAWSCWQNQQSGSDGARVREARDACVWLIDRERPWVVTVLHKMHGGVISSFESNELRFLGELAPLACDVATVLNRAALLTKRLRISLSHPFERRETVSPREALDDLLDGRGRKDYEDAIRDEAGELYGKASAEYLVAKRFS
jgi:hypothetical protein